MPLFGITMSEGTHRFVMVGVLRWQSLRRLYALRALWGHRRLEVVCKWFPMVRFWFLGSSNLVVISLFLMNFVNTKKN